MTSLRHLALWCCVISALAGMLRLFWPENGFKTVINAVLMLYILTAGVQMVRGIDWHGLADELRNLPAGGSTVGYEAYRRELALPVDIRDKAAIESLLAVNAGTLPWQFAGDAP